MKDQAERLREMANQVRQQIETELIQQQVQRARVVAISSGKGGVGKSTLALNLALVLCTQGKKVLLLDADMGMANLDIMLGMVPKYNLFHMIQGKKNLDEIIIPGPQGMSIIPGGSGIQELANLPAGDMKRLLVELGRLDNDYDYMLLDTGAGISQNVTTFLLAADDAIIITSPEPTSLTDAYGVLKSMSRASYNGRVHLVVNRVSDDSEGILVAEKLKMVAQKYLGIDVVILGHIINDSSVSEGIRRQQPFVEIYPRSRATRNIERIAEKLLESHGDVTLAYLQDVKPPGIRNFFRRIISGLK
jgi:flagellar biosynthesis protein FlhG